MFILKSLSNRNWSSAPLNSVVNRSNSPSLEELQEQLKCASSLDERAAIWSRIVQDPVDEGNERKLITAPLDQDDVVVEEPETDESGHNNSDSAESLCTEIEDDRSTAQTALDTTGPINDPINDVLKSFSASSDDEDPWKARIRTASSLGSKIISDSDSEATSDSDSFVASKPAAGEKAESNDSDSNSDSDAAMPGTEDELTSQEWAEQHASLASSDLESSLDSSSDLSSDSDIDSETSISEISTDSDEMSANVGDSQSQNSVDFFSSLTKGNSGFSDIGLEKNSRKRRRGKQDAEDETDYEVTQCRFSSTDDDTDSDSIFGMCFQNHEYGGNNWKVLDRDNDIDSNGGSNMANEVSAQIKKDEKVTRYGREKLARKVYGSSSDEAPEEETTTFVKSNKADICRQNPYRPRSRRVGKHYRFNHDTGLISELVEQGRKHKRFWWDDYETETDSRAQLAASSRKRHRPSSKGSYDSS